VDTALEVATGEVTVELFKGRAVAVGRTSPQTLYLPQLASFDMAGYTPAHAVGFIRLFGLPLATAAHRGNAQKKEEPVGGVTR
jgi:argininosuccinate synthase